MSHNTKPLMHINVTLYRSLFVFFSVFGLSLMVSSFLMFRQASALSLTDVTKSVTSLLTMGQDKPDPIYVPAPSNAPSSANSAPSATTPNDALMAQAIAASGTAQSGNTNTAATAASKAVAATSPAESSRQGQIIQTRSSLYKTTELSATQHRLAQRVLNIGLLVGGVLLVIGLSGYSLQKLFAYKREHPRSTAPHHEGTS